MDVLGLLILLLSALVPAALGALRDYHIVNLLKNWTEAQSYCREKFFELATVGDVEEWAKLKQQVAISGHEQAWIGLYDDINSWRWSLDNKLLYENGSIGLGSWFVFSVNNLNNKGCALVYQNILQDAPCSLSRVSVCYDEPTNSFIHVYDNRDWQSAQSYCRSTYTDLASIRNQQELNAVIGPINDPSWGWWVGLSREGWKWSDQSEPSYSAWRTAPRKRLLKLKLKTDPLVEMNDPQIQFTILDQIERQLQRQGIRQQLQLRWRRQPNGNVFNKTML